jgi:hypothetical protein
MSASLAVVLASDQTAVSTTGAKAATATLTNVAASASSTTLLASNANRLGAVIVNDSTSVLYVKYGATASSTSYTYRLGINATLTLDGALLYTGLISGIWVSATGAARITELTA